MDYSIVIPVYNEEKNIPIIYKKLIKILNEQKKDFEIIFINDGSKDKSLEILKEYSKKDKRVKYLSFSRNFGHQAALTAGLDYASGNAIISMDCDMQDPPEIVKEMIKKWKQGYDVVYARRRNRKESLFKKQTAVIYYKLLDKFSDVKIPRNVGDFRLIDKKVLNELKNMKEKARYLRGMVAWLGFKYAFVDFDRPNRIHGETGYSLRKMIRLGMDGVLNFSMLPLKIGFILGLLSILSGFFFLIYMIFDIIFNQVYYPLYKWLAIISIMFFGFLFMLIWILGEYIGRIYDESKGRPLYIINEKNNL